MLNFIDYIKEDGDDLPVISISKELVDCSKEDTRDEINDNLEAALDDQRWLNPYGGWLRAAKVLALYSVTLPKVIFKDIFDGEEIVAISQFGDKMGATPTGGVEMTPDETEYYFYYSYGRNDDGTYDSFAAVVDEAGLNELVSDETDHLNPEGELDPRQE